MRKEKGVNSSIQDKHSLMHPSSYMQTQPGVYSVCITLENFHKHAIQVAHYKNNLLT